MFKPPQPPPRMDTLLIAGGHTHQKNVQKSTLLFKPSSSSLFYVCLFFLLFENYPKWKFIDSCWVGCRPPPFRPVNKLQFELHFCLPLIPCSVIVPSMPRPLLSCCANPPFCVSFVCPFLCYVGAMLFPSNRTNQQLLPERKGIHFSESWEAVHGGSSARQQLEDQSRQEAEREGEKIKRDAAPSGEEKHCHFYFGVSFALTWKC